MLISIEGIEGTGKSTIAAEIKKYLENNNIDVLLTREPGGTPVAEAIRGVLLSHWPEDKMEDEVELMLMFASRMQHVQRLVKPAINQGKWVVSDRFTDASFAYQGGGRGISLQRIQYLSDWVLQGFKPDLTLLLDAKPEVAIARIDSRQGGKDRIEMEELVFFNQVRETYLELAHQDVSRVKIIDVDRPLMQVFNDVRAYLDVLMSERHD